MCFKFNFLICLMNWRCFLTNLLHVYVTTVFIRGTCHYIAEFVLISPEFMQQFGHTWHWQLGFFTMLYLFEIFVSSVWVACMWTSFKLRVHYIHIFSFCILQYQAILHWTSPRTIQVPLAFMLSGLPYQHISYMEYFLATKCFMAKLVSLPHNTAS